MFLLFFLFSLYHQRFSSYSLLWLDLQQNNNSTLISKEPLGEDGRKQRHQYEALLRLLGNTLPASGKKCFCGVSRSSSVVSNRSASSPEPDSIGGIRPAPLSPISPGSCRSESAVNSLTESHASSPEMTWVRQAIVRYWHNWPHIYLSLVLPPPPLTPLHHLSAAPLLLLKLQYVCLNFIRH